MKCRSSMTWLLLLLLLVLLVGDAESDRSEEMLKELVGDLGVMNSPKYVNPLMEMMFFGGDSGTYYVAHTGPGTSFGVFSSQQLKYGEVIHDGEDRLHWQLSSQIEKLANAGVSGDILQNLDDYSIEALLLLLHSSSEQCPYRTQLEILSTQAVLSEGASPYQSPLVWSDEDLELLFPSYTQELVQRQKKAIMSVYDYLATNLFSIFPDTYHPQVFTAENWLSIYSSVRAMTFPSPSNLEMTLVPFISTFRHSLSDSAVSYWDTWGIRVAAKRKYNNNEEIKINYLDIYKAHLVKLREADLLDEKQLQRFARDFLDPAHMLLTFGQIPELPHSAAFAKVIFRIALPFADPAVGELLLPDLKSMPIVDTQTMTATVSIQSEGVPFQLMMLSRMLSLRFRELHTNVLEQLVAGQRVSLDNELRATRRVIHVLRQQLDRYIDSPEIIMETTAHQEAFSPRKQVVAAMSLLAAEQLCLRKALETMHAHWNAILLEAE